MEKHNGLDFRLSYESDGKMKKKSKKALKVKGQESNFFNTTQNSE